MTASNVKFGDAPLEDFITVDDKIGKFVSKLNYKRIFYILQFNALEPDIKTLRGRVVPTGEQQFKIGISHQPQSRLKSYYNSFGSNYDKKKCSGVKVLMLCGTDKDRNEDYITQRDTYQIEQLERHMKKELKQRGMIIRGTEFIKCMPTTLLNMVKSYLPKLKQPTLIKRKLGLRPAKPVKK